MKVTTILGAGGPMTATTQPTNPREAAVRWIADVIVKHLDPKLHDPDRIKGVAAQVEQEAFASNWPIETAIELAIEWCENENEENGLTHATQN